MSAGIGRGCWLRNLAVAAWVPLFAVSHAAEVPGPNPPVASPTPLQRLLSQAGEEPLVCLALEDLPRFTQSVLESSLGRIFWEEQYGRGRAALATTLGEQSGLELPALWQQLKPLVEGPLALVLQQSGASGPSGGGGLRWRLLIGCEDTSALRALEEGWKAALREVKGEGQEAQKAPTGEARRTAARVLERQIEWRPLLTGQGGALEALPEWVRRCGRGEGALRFLVRPAELAAGLAAGKDQTPGGQPLPVATWVRWLTGARIKRLDWRVTVKGAEFREALAAEMAGPEEGPLGGILGLLKEHPRPWKSLEAALPGGQDAVLLLQADFNRAGAVLAPAVRLAERALRGKKWTQRLGDEAEARDPERFRFLTETCPGTLGLAGKLGISGEFATVTAGATKGTEVAALRALLLERLGRLEAPFQELKGAAAIGGQSPLGALFRGRGVLPAPVLGLSEGWLWLCSSPTAYAELTGAFQSGQTLASDKLLGGLRPGLAAGGEEPAASCLQLRLNLARLVPLLYTAWMLSEEGPQVGGWKVPLEWLPPPNLFAKRLGVFQAELERVAGGLRGRAVAPVPGGSLLLAGALWGLAEAVSDLQARSVEGLQERLEAVEDPPSRPDGGTRE